MLLLNLFAQETAIMTMQDRPMSEEELAAARERVLAHPPARRTGLDPTGWGAVPEGYEHPPMPRPEPPEAERAAQRTAHMNRGTRNAAIVIAAAGAAWYFARPVVTAAGHAVPSLMIIGGLAGAAIVVGHDAMKRQITGRTFRSAAIGLCVAAGGVVINNAGNFSDWIFRDGQPAPIHAPASAAPTSLAGAGGPSPVIGAPRAHFDPGYDQIGDGRHVYIGRGGGTLTDFHTHRRIFYPCGTEMELIGPQRELRGVRLPDGRTAEVYFRHVSGVRPDCG
jgi:hypothetical protein